MRTNHYRLTVYMKNGEATFQKEGTKKNIQNVFTHRNVTLEGAQKILAECYDPAKIAKAEIKRIP